MAFTDVYDRDHWLTNAKWLKNFNTTNKLNMFLQPDLPPQLCAIQNELLKVRRDVSAEIKKQSYLKYHAHWPYVSLLKKINEKANIINHSVTKSAIVDNVLK